MIPNENLITSRESVRINQWWTSADLCDARGDMHGLLVDHMQRLSDNLAPPEMLGFKSYFIDSMMPRKNEQYRGVRTLYPKDINRGEVPDNYNDDARRSRMTIPDWFALMLRTWTFDTLHYTTQPGDVNPEHSEYYSTQTFETEIRRDASQDIYRRTNTWGPRPYKKIYERDWQKHKELRHKIGFMNWPKDEALQQTRRQYVGGLIEVIEKCLTALPVAEEAEVRSKMRLVMEQIEPSWRDRARFTYIYRLSAVQEHVLMITKGWFAEVRDLYLYGVTPPVIFDYNTYITNIMHCGVREIFPDVKNITNMHIRSWVYRSRENQRLYGILAGKSHPNNLVGDNTIRTVAPCLWLTISESRTGTEHVTHADDNCYPVICSNGRIEQWL